MKSLRRSEKKKTEEKYYFKEIYLEFMSLFNCDSKESLINNLIDISPPSKSVCAKKLKSGSGAWVCKDCEKDTSCVICPECYEKSKDKHVNHKKYFKSSVSGCCDCGDPDSWDPEGFCSDHKGIITSDEEIKTLINNTFNELQLSKINKLLESLFNSLVQSIASYEEEQDLVKGNTHVEAISEALMYLEILSASNSALLHIIVNYFLKSFEFKTKHICFMLQNDSKKLSKMEITEQLHLCTCSFFQNIIRIWGKNFDNVIKIDKILFTFLKSYKFKYLFGLSYLSLYDTVMLNDSEYLRNFSVQVLTIEDIAEVIVSSEEFVENLFTKLYYLTDYYLQNESTDDQDGNNYETLFRIIFEFFMDINYLSKPKPAKILSKNVKIIKILIDNLDLIQNRIKFKIAKSFQYEGFQENFVLIELYLLFLFSLLTTNFDFSNSNNADDVLFYLIDKIRNSKKLAIDEYSFHIPLNRALAVFLNRYGFYYSLSQGIDLSMSFKNILYKYYNSVTTQEIDCKFENIVGDIVKDTIKFFGFLNSIQCKYWVYYGENMLYYNVLYYIYEQFYLSDFVIVKLLITQDFSSKYLNLKYFLDSSDINDSYKINLEYLFSRESLLESPSLSLFEKNLELFISISCYSDYLIDLLAISAERLASNRMLDDLTIKVFSQNSKKDDQEAKEFLRNKLIHIILRKGNSAYFSEIIKLVPFYLKDNNHNIYNQEKIEITLNEICDKIKSGNRPLTFSLKNDIFKETDLFNIYDTKSKVSAEKYLNEFKINEISIINTTNNKSLLLIQEINKQFDTNFFHNSFNLEIIINTTIFLLEKLNKQEINPSLNIVIYFMKLVDMLIRAILRDCNLHYLKDKILNRELMDALQNINSSDLSFRKCCQYLYNRFEFLNSQFNIIVETNNDCKDKGDLITNKLSNNDNRKNKIRELKEKVKLIFKEKIRNFKMNCGMIKEEIKLTNQIKIEEEKATIQCIVCRNKIEQNECLSKPYGRIGVFSPSSHLYHSKLQTMKKEYEKIVLRNKFKQENDNSYINSIENSENLHSYGHLLVNEEQLFIKDLMLSYKRSKPELKRSVRFYSCNHFIHFSCFETMILKYHINNSNRSLLFICPLCKTISNIYIPSIKTNFKQSFSFSDLYDLHKQRNFSIEGDTENTTSADESKDEISAVNSLSYFIENILILQSKTQYLINDLKDNIKRDIIYANIKQFFINSVNYLDILKYHDYEKVIEILKDFINVLKSLIKYKIIDFNFFLNKLAQMQFYWDVNYCNFESLLTIIEADKVSEMFLENIFLALVIFDESESKNLGIIFRNFFPLILVQFLSLQMYINSDFRISKEKLKEKYNFEYLNYLITSSEHKTPLKNFMVFYLRKVVILKRIFAEDISSEKLIKNNFIDIDAEFQYYCEDINLDSNFIEYFNIFNFSGISMDTKEITSRIFNEYFNSKLKSLEEIQPYNEESLINPSLLLITNNLKFQFISLPPNLLELSCKYFKQVCNNCGTNPSYAILCLICGEKICYTEACCKNYGKKKNIYEYVWHNKICGSGDGVYLHLYNGEVTLSLLGNFVSTKIGIYQNRFGETVKSRSVSDEYVLQSETLNNLLCEFNNLSYRNYLKINNSYYFTAEDDLDEFP